MYFKVSMRTNPATGVYSGYYRLVESYRDPRGRVCHRTILNAGYLDELTTDQLNLIQKILTAKVASHDNPLFELPCTHDARVDLYTDDFYKRMVAEKRIDVFVEKNNGNAVKSGKDLQMIDLNSIRHKDVREIGAEWLSYQAPWRSTSSDMPSTCVRFFITSSRSAGLHGAMVKPQLPISAVVTPREGDGETIGSQVTCAS
jgi:hypothetical protein